MEKPSNESLSVLIVGAGPSGLMMAHELKRFGLAVTLIEKDLEKTPYSRAIGVQIRTLEIFSALGLYHHLAEKAQKLRAVEIFAEGRAPIQITFEQTTSDFSGLAAVEQPHTEQVLEEANQRLGIKTLRGIELIDYERRDHGVEVTLRHHDNTTERQKFRYLIGADGAHSTVRQRMANPFLGSTYDDAFILADAQCEHPFDHHTVRVFFKNKLFLVLLPLHGDGHYRLISVRRGESQKVGPKPTIEEFQNLAKQLVPFPFAIKSSTWVSRFFVQCRSVNHYQEDPVFLIGDAAHIHSPAGGQGMNTGLQDAFNLAWKMAMVSKKMAKPSLLDTYHQERKPVGDFLLDRTDRLFKFMVKSSIWARLLRRFVLPRVARVRALRAKLALIGSQTAIRYEHGAICTNGTHGQIPPLRIGTRIPNVSLMTGLIEKTDLHTVTSGLYFSVLFFMPPSVDKNTIALTLKHLAEVNEQVVSATSARLIFALETDAKKARPNAEYAFIVSNGRDFFTTGLAYYVIARPDQHVFCAGALTEFDHGIESLKTYLIEKKEL